MSVLSKVFASNPTMRQAAIDAKRALVEWLYTSYAPGSGVVEALSCDPIPSQLMPKRECDASYLPPAFLIRG